MTEIVVKVTDSDLPALLRHGVIDITADSHPDFIAVAHPSVVKLDRRTAHSPVENAEEPVESPGQIELDSIDEYRMILADSAAAPSCDIGDFVVDQNPYLLASQLRLRKTD